MSKAILAAVPIKPFGVAKARLSAVLDARSRSQLGKAVAARTAAAATDAGALVAIVTGDSDVAKWARAHGYLTIDENISTRPGLNGAGEAALYEATRRQRSWAIVHADLPLVTPAALKRVFKAARQSLVLVPSHDGGTNVIAGMGSAMSFSYGQASFHSHFAQNPAARVVTDPRLALDLDVAADLQRALTHPDGRWLRRLVPDLARASHP
ncbi:MAG: 2-phospho-L-lactate guanylyltransferase [Acidimicrobiia bacterium]|nr:2-phospho-L-lactate guanylyltransferase [Acidimicrobiia bacterium]